MSLNLPTVNLASLAVGASGTVQLPQPKVQLSEQAFLRLYNESGCGLQIVFNDGTSETVPAGAWPAYAISPTLTQFTWTIQYVLPSAPISLLNIVYYFPGEPVPSTPALGNSPIGITGAVQTSSVQTLSNEGNAANTLVVDIGTVTIAQLLQIYTDHFLWQVQQSGVAHQVLKGQTSGNPLQLGQAGDITEVLGQLIVDQALTLLSTITLANAIAYQAKDTGGTARGILYADNSNNTVVRAAGGNVAFRDVANALLGYIDSSGEHIAGKTINDTAGNNLADWSAGGIYLKGNPSTDGPAHYQADGANTDWTFSAWNAFSGTGSGTFNHGLKRKGVGIVPDIIVCNPCGTASSSQTIGFANFTTTQVLVTTGAGLSWQALAIKLS